MAHEIVSVKGDTADDLKKFYEHKLRDGHVRVDGMLMPEHYKQFADAIENFEVRDDDVWVSSYPKTGTTWTQEMVWCVANDLDFDRAKESLNTRFPYLELNCFFDFSKVTDEEVPQFIKNSVSFVENSPSPRFIKTHLPFNLLPRQLRSGEKKAKIVYVARNAKDTCISQYHFARLLENFQGNFNEFRTLFIKDTVTYAPFWPHILSYWKRRINENVLFIKYEDMKHDLPSVLQKLAVFLGKTLTTDQVSTLTEHLSFEIMKGNPAANNEDIVSIIQGYSNSGAKGKFMRSGQTDQWKTDMSSELIDQFDSWICENLKGTGLEF